MKQQEKTKLTKEKIILAALKEFGTKSYEMASLNTVCSEHNISKGLIYHNFKNKDELYLECIKICYTQMIESINKIQIASITVEAQLEQFLKSRQEFFAENPYLANIFFCSLLTPPEHLQKEISELRSDYNEAIKKKYRELLSNLELRSGISIEQAIDYMIMFQEMYNSYFRTVYSKSQDISKLIDIHEESITGLLNLALYGIAEKEKVYKK